MQRRTSTVAHTEIRPLILALLQRKSGLPKDFDGATDYISAGIVDSIGMIKFVLEIERRFSVEIAESDIASVDFRSLDGLAGMIGRKMSGKT